MVYVSLWKISSIFAVIVFGIMDMNCITHHNNKDMKIRNNDLSYKSIDIDIADGVSIHLYKCEYDELIKLLLPDMEQEIKNAYSLHQRAMEQRQQCWEMVKEIRELFYECSDEEFCIRKSLDEIEESKLVEVLEKYHKLLGFV